jgi:hypothetical protein
LTTDSEPGLVSRTIGAKGSFDMPIAVPNVGECTLAVMPALSSRAGKATRDGRGWGRYSGSIVVDKQVEGARRDIAVITVYAACTDDSGGGK